MSRFSMDRVVLFAILVLFPAVAFADALCQEATFVDTNSTLRVHEYGTAVPRCFETYVPTAGILVLEASAPSDAPAEPKLDFRGRACDQPAAFQKPFVHKDQFAASVLLEIREEGTYAFCVAAQDPTQILGDYKISTGFTPFNCRKENPDEDEPEPETSADPCPLKPARSLGYSGVLKDGFFKENPDEDEPEPETQIRPCESTEVDDLIHGICRASRTDDHSNVFRCATPVRQGQEIRGEIQNDYGDDEDLFSFVIDRLTSVRIETSGDTDTLGALYDRHGYRLKVDDNSGSGRNLRIVKTLSAGSYFVRIAGGHGDAGAYRLVVEVVGDEN